MGPFFDLEPASDPYGPHLRLDLRGIVSSGRMVYVRVTTNPACADNILEGCEKLLNRLIQYEKEGFLDIE